MLKIVSSSILLEEFINWWISLKGYGFIWVELSLGLLDLKNCSEYNNLIKMTIMINK